MPATDGNKLALKMDDRRKKRFLEKFRELGFARKACAAVNIGPSAMYAAARSDPEFKAAFNEVKEEWDELIEQEIHRRAVDGVPKPVVQGGKIVMVDQEAADGTITQVPLVLHEYSDRLLEFWARARMPERFGTKVKLDANINTGVMVVEDVLELGSFETEMAAEEERRIKRLEEDEDGTYSE